MSRYRDAAVDCKVYVGDLGNGASKQELEDAFSYYGPLRNVWVARNPPGFAFVEFEDARDAEDAVRGLDGRTVCGRRVRVELSTGRGRRFRGSGGSRFGGGGGGGGRYGGPDERCYDCGERGHYARHCSRRNRRSRSRSKSRSRSRGRRYSRSYSRSRSRSRGSNKSRSRSRSRSRSPAQRKSSA